MKKRVTAMLLVLLLLVSMLPTFVAASDTVGAVEAQIRAYADSIDQADAQSTAAKTLATHGMTKNGKKLVMNE